MAYVPPRAVTVVKSSIRPWDLGDTPGTWVGDCQLPVDGDFADELSSLDE